MKIIAQKNQEKPVETQVSGKTILIGRSHQNDVVLKDPRISRRHAQIFLHEGQWYLEDLNSDNGTLVNGQKISRVTIHSGDFFQIGPFTLQILASLNQMDDISPLTPSTIAATKENEEATEIIQFEETGEAKAPSNAFLKAISVSPSDESKTHIDVSEQGSLTEIEVKEENLKHDPESTEVTVVEQRVLVDADSSKSYPRLVCLDPEHLGEEIPLNKTELSFGSGTEVDVSVAEENIPTHVATISQSDDKTFVINSKSEQTGTYVEGKPIKERKLNDHDVLQIADARFEFVGKESESKMIKPKVLERSKPKGLLSSPLFHDWRYLIALGLLSGSLFSFSTYKKTSEPQTTEQSKEEASLYGNDESRRVALFHLTHAQELIANNKFDEAEARIRLILDQISPNHPDALKLLKKINVLRDRQRSLAKQQYLKTSKRHTQIRQLLAEGDRKLKENNFEESERIYKKAAALDPENPEAAAALEHFQKTKEDFDRRAIAKAQELVQLKKMYEQGIQEFESGQIFAAEKLLSNVAKKANPNRASAKKIISSIQAKKAANINVEVAKAETLIKEGKVDQGYKALQGLQKKYGKNKTLSDALTKVEVLMETRARDTYREALTLLEVANDPASALDMFQKVLQVAPKNSGYRKKAESKIQELQAP